MSLPAPSDTTHSDFTFPSSPSSLFCGSTPSPASTPSRAITPSLDAQHSGTSPLYTADSDFNDKSFLAVVDPVRAYSYEDGWGAWSSYDIPSLSSDSEPFGSSHDWKGYLGLLGLGTACLTGFPPYHLYTDSNLPSDPAFLSPTLEAGQVAALDHTLSHKPLSCDGRR